MKILIVSQYFWPENFRINDLAAGLVARGNEVYVLTGTPNYPSGKFFDGYGLFRKTFDNHNGVKIIRVPIVPRGSNNNIMLVLNYLSYAIVGSMFSFFLAFSRFDIIFVCQLSPVTIGIPAKVLKILTKKPIIHWILDLWPESIVATGTIKAGFVFKLIDRIVCSVYKSADKILVGSKGFIPSVSSRNVGSASIEYFPNWVEPEYSCHSAAPEIPSEIVMPDGFLVMFAGAVGVAQDFRSILHAAEALRFHQDIHWVILGDGRMFDSVKEEVRQKGLESIFHLLGRFQPNFMPAFF